eukprot:scaffold328_cov130-Cylindrotheca_fusiformis.AAC.32
MQAAQHLKKTPCSFRTKRTRYVFTPHSVTHARPIVGGVLAAPFWYHSSTSERASQPDCQPEWFWILSNDPFDSNCRIDLSKGRQPTPISRKRIILIPITEEMPTMTLFPSLQQLFLLLIYVQILSQNEVFAFLETFIITTRSTSLHPSSDTPNHNRLHKLASSVKDVEFQSSSQFGRGNDHLSAFLEPDDVVVYQTGSWLVDGVPVVGHEEKDDDNSLPKVAFAKIDTLQVVWTHNCEHGVVRGLQVELVNNKQQIRVVRPLEPVEFGPEQLIARIPIESWNENEEEEKEEGTEGIVSNKVPSLQSIVWEEHLMCVDDE